MEKAQFLVLLRMSLKNEFKLLTYCFEKVHGFPQCLGALGGAHVKTNSTEFINRKGHHSQENTCARVSFLIKLQAEACNFIKKETLAHVFSCEFCEIFKNTFFAEYLRWLLLYILLLILL